MMIGTSEVRRRARATSRPVHTPARMITRGMEKRLIWNCAQTVNGDAEPKWRSPGVWDAWSDHRRPFGRHTHAPTPLTTTAAESVAIRRAAAPLARDTSAGVGNDALHAAATALRGCRTRLTLATPCLVKPRRAYGQKESAATDGPGCRNQAPMARPSRGKAARGSRRPGANRIWPHTLNALVRPFHCRQGPTSILECIDL